MAEDRRAVLAADVEALAVTGGRIVDPPERLEQLRVADLGRVEPHLDRLGVAGAAPADPLIGGVRHMPAGIADSGLQHPVDLAESPLDSPEASFCEDRAVGPARAGGWQISRDGFRWRRQAVADGGRAWGWPSMSRARRLRGLLGGRRMSRARRGRGRCGRSRVRRTSCSSCWMTPGSGSWAVMA